MLFNFFKWPLFTFSIKWNTGILTQLIIGAGCQIEKDLKLTPSPPNFSKDSWNLLPCLYLSIRQVVVQKIYSKMQPVLCTNTHHDVTDLVNHGMVKNTKTWKSWERNKTFLRNKKILNAFLIWHILRSYSGGTL